VIKHILLELIHVYSQLNAVAWSHGIKFIVAWLHGIKFIVAYLAIELYLISCFVSVCPERK